MDLDALDRMISDAATTSSPRATIRRSSQRPPVISKLALDCHMNTVSPSSSSSSFSQHSNVRKQGWSYKARYRSALLALFTKAFLIGAAIKLVVKPDFSLSQSHSHDQSRFLRGNNVLLNDSPFRPRFINEIYYGGEDEDEDEVLLSLDIKVADSSILQAKPDDAISEESIPHL
mmetsp:Transcript_29247/g.48326  ORF Transcript_29247/g.48326 Transcript_29247/m.48326 type:complete len:174 (+) Transcript_29247:86-607(+)